MAQSIIDYYLSVTDPNHTEVGNLVITSPYGYRGDPPTMHNGTDLAHVGGSPTGFRTPVPFPAKITGTGYTSARGNWVSFEPLNNPSWQIIIQHLDNVDVSIDDELSPGDSIGGMGTTGYSSGNHWHIEVRETGTPPLSQSIVGDPENIYLPGLSPGAAAGIRDLQIMLNNMGIKDGHNCRLMVDGVRGTRTNQAISKAFSLLWEIIWG